MRYIYRYLKRRFITGIALWDKGGLIVPQAVVKQSRWRAQKTDSIIPSKFEGMKTMEANPNLSLKTQELGG